MDTFYSDENSFGLIIKFIDKDSNESRKLIWFGNVIIDSTICLTANIQPFLFELSDYYKFATKFADWFDIKENIELGKIVSISATLKKQNISLQIKNE